MPFELDSRRASGRLWADELTSIEITTLAAEGQNALIQIKGARAAFYQHHHRFCAFTDRLRAGGST
jgi:hypothetical protein